jgi:hypothetical protein
MLRFSSAALAVFTFLFPSMLVYASPTTGVGPDYYCTIERVLDAGRPDEPDVKGYPVSERFIVDRQTGVMTGGLRNSYLTQPQVIDYGSPDNSYQVVTTMKLDQGVGRGSNLHSLVIREWASGLEKPFVYLWNMTVYFGSCRHN